MQQRGTWLNNAAATSGAWTFLLGALIIGPVGLVLLGALVYAMYVSNLALGIVCLLILASPLALMALWMPLLGASRIVERLAERPAEKDALEAKVNTVR